MLSLLHIIYGKKYVHGIGTPTLSEMDCGKAYRANEYDLWKFAKSLSLNP